MRKRIVPITETEIKTGRVDQACLRYGLGRDAMYQVAKDAGADIRIGRSFLINFTIMDKYFDSISGA